MKSIPGIPSGPDRRNKLLQIIKESQDTITASSLARTLGVTRQVIVQDVALLRAYQEPILSTSRGYIYQQSVEPEQIRRMIYCFHEAEDTTEELHILVDHGLTVLDVGVQHSVYGFITRELNLKSRLDVSNFISHITKSEVTLLSSLTNGLHYHTVICPNLDAFNLAYSELANAGFLAGEEFNDEKL